MSILRYMYRLNLQAICSPLFVQEGRIDFKVFVSWVFFLKQFFFSSFLAPLPVPFTMLLSTPKPLSVHNQLPSACSVACK